MSGEWRIAGIEVPPGTRARSTMLAHTFPSIGLASTAVGSVVVMSAARKACAGR